MTAAHLTTAGQFAKKIHVESLENHWLSGPQLAQLQLFCSARTIMARALLNCCLFHVPLTSPRQQFLAKIHVGAHLESR